MEHDKLEAIFTYHSPTAAQATTYGLINRLFLDLAIELNRLMPKGPGHMVAIRKLNEARNAANSAVALEGKF